MESVENELSLLQYHISPMLQNLRYITFLLQYFGNFIFYIICRTCKNFNSALYIYLRLTSLTIENHKYLNFFYANNN